MDGILSIQDIFLDPEEKTIDSLLWCLADVGLELNLEAITMTVLESHPIVPYLRKHWYALRPERSSVMVHVQPGIPQEKLIRDKTQWLMTVGDRDV